MSSQAGEILDRSLYDGRLRTPEFYRSIGFRSGLEVHQQLLTETKLFCHCPAGLYSEHHDAAVLRHMRPTLSELGEYDGTALMEFKTRKDVVYLLDSRSVCTYEMDDTPPFQPNPEALRIAVEISLLLGCRPVGEVHISRKQYLDGSIPTGFQRTAIVGVEGSIPYKDREIGIHQLAIEEDSCREVEDIGHRIVFRTDRLSMPLVEVVTRPEMRTPLEVAEVGRRIGRLLRCTGHVRRGLGSVRQDVNVSVNGGTRIEMKGVSRIPLFPCLTHNEAMRQLGLLKIRDWLRRRRVTADSLQGPSADVTGILAATYCPGLRKALAAGHSIRALVLRGFQPVLLEEIQPGIPFAQEFSGRVRVIACLDQSSNLFVRGADLGFGLYRHHRMRRDGRMERPVRHIDPSGPGLTAAFWGPKSISQDPEYGPSAREWSTLAGLLKAGPKDGILLFFGPDRDLATAESEILIRAREALGGVPSETRQPFASGTTDFERILPGPDRMYPDTDLPPIALSESYVESIQSGLPELPWKREERYLAMGLGAMAALQMVDSPFHELFDLVVNKGGLKAGWAHRLFAIEAPAAIGRGLPIAAIPETVWLEMGRAWAQGIFHREALPALLAYLAREASQFKPSEELRLGPKLAEERAHSILRMALDSLDLRRQGSRGELEAEIRRTAALEAGALRPEIRKGNRSSKCERALAGSLRRRYGGMIPGRDVNSIAIDAVAAVFKRSGPRKERSKV